MLNYQFYLPRPDRFYRLFRSRFCRLDIDLATVQEVLAEYDLALVKRPHMPGGAGRSRSLIVQTPQGKKVFKRYVPNRTLPVIVYEHSILRHLAQVDFPAPRLLATPTGETIVHKGENYYALFDFIEGGFQYHNYLLLPAQTRHFIASAGQALATLHSQLEGFTPEGRNPYGFSSQTGDWWQGLEWYLSKLAHCVQETQRLQAIASLPQAACLLRQAGHLEKALVQLDRTLKVAALPRLIIHSDYGPYNLLFRPNAPLAILDFEIARLDWRLSEFVYALPRFAHGQFGFDFDKAKCLIDAYRTCRPMDDDELRFIPDVWQFLRARQAIVCWHSCCETHTASRLTETQSHLKWVNWAAEHQDGLVNRLIRS